MGIIQQLALWLPLLGAVILAAALGYRFDQRRAPSRREVLLTGNAQRAKATVDYYVHVLDSND
jgi:hypothetical protein